MLDSYRMRPPALLPALLSALLGTLPAGAGAVAAEAAERALGGWQEEVAKAQRVHDAARAKADAKALKALEGLATAAAKRGEVAEAAAAWKEALRIDPTHPPARAFFQAIGTLDQVVAEVTAPTDLLGNPLPAPAGMPADAPTQTVGAAPGQWHRLGALRPGQTVWLQYVDGTWNPRIGVGPKSPDEENDPAFRMVIGTLGADGAPQILATVPPGTAAKPFSWPVEREVAEAALWITPSPRAANFVGSVRYKVAVTP